MHTVHAKHQGSQIHKGRSWNFDKEYLNFMPEHCADICDKITVAGGQFRGHQQPLREGFADAALPQMLGGKCSSASFTSIIVLLFIIQLEYITYFSLHIVN
jgi:hypothetical protein